MDKLHNPAPDSPSPASTSPDPGGAVSEGMGGRADASSLPDSEPGEQAGGEEQGSDTGRTAPSGDRVPKEGTANPEGDRELWEPTAPVPAGANSIISAIKEAGPNANILQILGERFVSARKEQKAEAWRQLQSDLMLSASYICPLYVPFKDLLTAAREIEEFIKGSTGHAGKSNEELMANFLTGGDAIPVHLTKLEPPEGIDLATVSIEDTLDTDDTMESGDGEVVPSQALPPALVTSPNPSSPVSTSKG